MKSQNPASFAADKAETGIIGFDETTGGGLPRGRTSLLLGGPGSGKTIFAVQYLVHGARMAVADQVTTIRRENQCPRAPKLA